MDTTPTDMEKLQKRLESLALRLDDQIVRACALEQSAKILIKVMQADVREANAIADKLRAAITGDAEEVLWDSFSDECAHALAHGKPVAGAHGSGPLLS